MQTVIGDQRGEICGVQHKKQGPEAENHYGVRGHEKKLSKDKSRLDARKFFFSQRVVNSWNSLPAEVVNAESVNGFKNAYDRSCHKDMDDRS